MRNFKLMIVMLIALLVFAGCSTANEVEPEVKDEPVKAVFIVRTNLGDKSFNDSAWSGLKMAEAELGYEVSAVEIGGDQTKYEPTFIDAVESDADIILVGSPALIEVADQYVAQYPDKKFVYFDVAPTFVNNHDNVVALSFKQNESSFLAGALAGLMTESNNIGFVGGTENIVINDFLTGYIKGATYTNPEIKVQVSFIGSFSDAAKGKELGLVQIDNGADFVHSVAGGAGLGVIEAVAERQVWSIGVDADQALALKDTSPEKSEVIITSALKLVGNALFEVFKTIEDGSVQWGSLYAMGINEKAAGIAVNEYYDKNVPAEVKETMLEIESKVKIGEIKVTSAFDLTQDEINALKDSVRP